MLGLPLKSVLIDRLRLAALGLVACGFLAPMARGAEPVSYAHQVLPLLRARCQGCHQKARAEGGVNLTSLEGMLAEAESGLFPVKPGDPDASELIAQVTSDDTGEALMPKQGRKLTTEEIDLLRRWIAEGAKIDAASDRPTFDREHPPMYAAPPTASALDVSPDGSLIAVSGINETLLVDAAAAARGEQKILHRLIGMAERIESVRFSPDGARLAVAGGLPGEQGELQVWDVATGELALSLPITSDSLQGVAWSPDGKLIAFGGADTNLYAVDAESGETKVEQGAHSDWVLDAVFSTDGKYLISGARDQTLKLTETESGRLVENITSISPNVVSGQIFGVARHPSRDMVAIGGSEGVPRTYMVHRAVDRKIGDDSNLIRAYPPVPGRIFAVAFSPDGTRLAVASSDAAQGYVQVFAVPDAFAPPDDVKNIQSKEVFNRSAEEKARLEAYNHEGAIRLAYAATPMPPVYALAFSGDGRSLVSAGADGQLRFHDAAHGTLLSQISPYPLTSAPGEPKAGAAVAEASTNPPTDAEASLPAHIEFLTDVMPVLGKLGCNSGTCHGSRTGQNGFSLSLRGYDPLGDHRALTDDLAGRRVNRAKPESSLMLLKPTGGVPHAGGQVLEPGTRRYEIIRRWVAEGAVFNAEAPRVASIELGPQNPIVDQPGQEIAMRVTAHYTDGSTRDVTADAFVDSGNTECATADVAGKLTAVRRGEAPVLARYEGSYAATTLTVMGDRSGYEWKPQPVYNHIDELVDVKLQRMKIVASGLCTDEEFLRRVHLDLTGLPPTADQVRAFLADGRESRAKRNAVIDELIGSPDYIEHWTNRWADLLMVNGRFLGAMGASAYRDWIRQAIADNKPYDQFVHELFVSTGSNREHPGGSYFKVLRDPTLIAETTTQVFMGVRFNCNKCHDHPFERWTQNDYYGWAAFFADIKLEKDPASGDEVIPGSAVEESRPLFEMITDGTGGQMIHLRTGKVAPPHFPFTAGQSGAESTAVLRQRAADWLTSADNRYFATSYVNRVWANLTGVGLIDPIDDIRAGNPPTNPELLEWLTQEFVTSGFDVRALIRSICQSRTYQLSGEANPFNEDDRRNYSHALPRRLPAEALYDAVYRAIGSVSHFPGMPAGMRAAALPDSMIEVESGLLSKLGRPARESGCECERSSDLQLGPVMALINGPTFADAIDDPESELAKLEAATPDDAALAKEVFLRVLGREPQPAELTAAVELLAYPGGEHVQADAELAARVKDLEPGFEDWRRANHPIRWKNLKPTAMTSTNGAALAARDDDSVLVTGDNGKTLYQVVAGAPGRRLRGLRLEALADDQLPAKGPGRAANGNFVVNTLRLFIQHPDHPEKRRKVKLRTAEATFSQAAFPITGVIDAKPQTGWAVAPEMGKNHTAVFAFTRPVRVKPGEQLVVELDQQFDDTHTLGCFRLAATADAEPLMRPDHGEMNALLTAEKLDDAGLARLREYYFTRDGRYVALQRAQKLLANPRLAAVQDLAWALINSPAFLFNH